MLRSPNPRPKDPGLTFLRRTLLIWAVVLAVMVVAGVCYGNRPVQPPPPFQEGPTP